MSWFIPTDGTITVNKLMWEDPTFFVDTGVDRDILEYPADTEFPFETIIETGNGTEVIAVEPMYIYRYEPLINKDKFKEVYAQGGGVLRFEGLETGFVYTLINVIPSDNYPADPSITERINVVLDSDEPICKVAGNELIVIINDNDQNYIDPISLAESNVIFEHSNITVNSGNIFTNKDINDLYSFETGYFTLSIQGGENFPFDSDRYYFYNPFGSVGIELPQPATPIKEIVENSNTVKETKKDAVKEQPSAVKVTTKQNAVTYGGTTPGEPNMRLDPREAKRLDKEKARTDILNDDLNKARIEREKREISRNS